MCACDRFVRSLGYVAIPINDTAFVAVRVHLLPSPKVWTYIEKMLYKLVPLKTLYMPQKHLHISLMVRFDSQLSSCLASNLKWKFVYVSTP